MAKDVSSCILARPSFILQSVMGPVSYRGRRPKVRYRAHDTLENKTREGWYAEWYNFIVMSYLIPIFLVKVDID